MTATADPQNLPAQVDIDDALAQVQALAMQQLQQQFDRAYRQLSLLPEEQARTAQAALLASWDIVGAMLGEWQSALCLVKQQRDQALTELNGLVQALEIADYRHPLVSEVIREMYSHAMEEHNGNFWESLPYDVAQTMGKGWTHSDAEALVELIIDHDDWDEEEWAEEHGWALEDVQKARATIHKAVRKLDGNK
jgi:hypothetical protein